MRSTVTTFLFAFIVATSAGQSVDSPFSITISGPKTAKAGQPIAIMISMRGTSDHKVDLMRHKYPVFDYAVEVLNSKGEAAPHTSRGHYIATRQCGGNDIEVNGGSCLQDWARPIRAELAPKAKHEERIDVRRLFYMSEPGDYSIRVSRSTAGESPIVVQSNAITVTVIQ